MTHTAARLAPFGTTIFTEMTLLAQKHGAVNLAQGFPDFDGPDFVKLAARQALDSGQNQYARMFGIPTLNAAIAGWWLEQTGSTIDPDAQVCVTSGCTEAIAAAMLGLVNPGDEVILFQPYYDSYPASIAMAGGVPKVVTLRPPAASGQPFWFDPDELSWAFTDKTRAILINTPHNPTGKVFSSAELRQIADLCIRRDVLALTDEVYERLTYSDAAPHMRLATIPGMEGRTLTLSSLGKTFSLTGWKVGWAIGHPDLVRSVRAAHQFLTFATAAPLQHGAAAALGRIAERENYLKELLAHFSWARKFLGESLQRLGFRVYSPDGAYFIMADWTTCPRARCNGVDDDRAFCKALTTEAGVAAIPPSVFYSEPSLGRSLVRFAFCKRRETLEEAVKRLQAWIGAL
ncbi:MAG: aminotransferase class I/II-fold pyridoxal phosphate-dependent enzyme [Phycisphaerales bacterium]